MAGSWLLLLAFRVSSCIVATSGWASSGAFLVSRSQPFAFFLLFLFLMSSFSLRFGPFATALSQSSAISFPSLVFRT